MPETTLELLKRHAKKIMGMQTEEPPIEIGSAEEERARDVRTQKFQRAYSTVEHGVEAARPRVNKIAELAMKYSSPGALAGQAVGAKTPEQLQREAKEEESRDLQRQIDAYKNAQNQSQINELRKKLPPKNLVEVGPSEPDVHVEVGSAVREPSVSVEVGPAKMEKPPSQAVIDQLVAAEKDRQRREAIRQSLTSGN